MPRLRHRTRRDVETFVPTFCPYPDCEHHTLCADEDGEYRFQRRGFRRTERKPGIVRRFLCLCCGRTFSSSAFFDCYRRRKATIAEAVFRGYCEGQAGRQIARTTGQSLKTVQQELRRMARQALLFHLVQLRGLAEQLATPLVIDALRCFAGSQWEPGDLYTAVAGDTLFWLDVDYVGLRRSGRMTPRQRRIRGEREERLGRPPAGAARRVCRQMLRRLAALFPEDTLIRVASDDETPLARAIQDLQDELPIRHETISSRVWREMAGHILWPVNHEHRLNRHGGKNHTRETLAFSKTAAGLMDRALLHRVWRNNVKGVSERNARDARTTPAMRLGLTDRALRADDIFHARLFPKRVGLPAELADQYAGVVKSRPGESAGAYRYKTQIAA